MPSTKFVRPSGRFFKTCFAVLAAAVLSFAAADVEAQDGLSRTSGEVNRNTVSIISGNVNGTYLYIASDIAAVLDQGDELRVLPVVGKGGAQNIRDLLLLRGIDMGIVRSDALTYMRNEGYFRNIDGRLRFITRLYNEEMHVFARREIQSFRELDGKRVNFSDRGSGTQTTVRLVFDALGMDAQEFNMGQSDAYEAMKAGEIDATILVAGKPSGSFSRFQADDRFHVLKVPYDAALQNDYLPTKLTHDDYPNLLQPGEEVETIAVGAVLAVFNWSPDNDRYRRVVNFVDAFFSQIEDFKRPPRHPKWKEVNIAAELPGWQRFRPAEEWLARAQQSAAVQSQQQQSEFNRFIADQSAAAGGGQQLSNEQREQLFQQFLQWRQQGQQ